MRKIFGFAFAVILAFAGGSVLAQQDSVNIIIPMGHDAQRIVDAFAGGAWNQDGEFACKTGSPKLIVQCLVPNCAQREVEIEFALTGGGPPPSCVPPSTAPCTLASHDVTYFVDGSSGQPLHTFAYDGNGPFPINDGVFVFDLGSGDELTLTTRSGVFRAPTTPALGKTGTLVALLALSAGILLVLRYRQA